MGFGYSADSFCDPGAECGGRSCRPVSRCSRIGAAQTARLFLYCQPIWGNLDSRPAGTNSISSRHVCQDTGRFYPPSSYDSFAMFRFRERGKEDAAHNRHSVVRLTLHRSPLRKWVQRARTPDYSGVEHSRLRAGPAFQLTVRLPLPSGGSASCFLSRKARGLVT